MVSDRHNHGTDTRFATLDMHRRFLPGHRPLTRPEYVSIPCRLIPDDVLIKYRSLRQFNHPISSRQVHVATVSCKLPTSLIAILLNISPPTATSRTLVSPVFFPAPPTEISSPCLIVDDFGVKYTSRAVLDHLLVADPVRQMEGQSRPRGRQVSRC